MRPSTCRASLRFACLLADGRAYLVPFDAAFEMQQQHRFDVGSLAWLALGSATSAGDAIDLARGSPAGTAEPFVISRGSVDDGTWDLVGTNPGVIFFGMGAQPSHVDGPSTTALALLGIGLAVFGARRRARAFDA